MCKKGEPTGDIAAHRARAYMNEPCCFFTDSLNVVIPLQLDCLDSADITSCIALCMPGDDARLTP